VGVALPVTRISAGKQLNNITKDLFEDFGIKTGIQGGDNFYYFRQNAKGILHGDQIRKLDRGMALVFGNGLSGGFWLHSDNNCPLVHPPGLLCHRIDKGGFSYEPKSKLSTKKIFPAVKLPGRSFC